MTITYISSGQTSSSPITPGNQDVVLNGGSIVDVSVLSNAGAFISSGGVATDTILSTLTANLATLTVYDGGVANNTSVEVGGFLYVSSGGVASGGSLSAGGGTFGPRAVAYAGGLIEGMTASFGGFESPASGGVVSGAIMLAGSLERVLSGGVAINTDLVGGTLTIFAGGIGGMSATASVPDTGTVSMTSGAELVVSGFVMPQAVISGFTPGAVIDLTDIDSSSITNVTTSGNTLTVTAGGTDYTLNIVGAGTYGHSLLSDGVTGTFVMADNPACYAAGTLILAEHGEMPVEALAIGDVVVTASGEHRPVRWIGRRSYGARFLAANPGVQPIRFCAGSLGVGLPRRDLLVSPDHAMFLDGVLVPARHLVNGRTIVKERGLQQVDYYHVELDSHDVLVAEGAPSESFVDDDSRGVFHNADEWARLYPGRTPVPALFCAPRLESGPELEAIRRRLDAEAGQVARAA